MHEAPARLEPSGHCSAEHLASRKSGRGSAPRRPRRDIKVLNDNSIIDEKLAAKRERWRIDAAKARRVNAEKINQQRRERYALTASLKTPEQREAERARGRKKIKIWRVANPELAKSQKKRWLEKYRERARQKTAKWREENPERARASSRSWAANNPDKARAIQSRHRARKVEAQRNTLKASEVKLLKSKSKRCYWCKSPWPKVGPPTLDHVISLAAGGDNSIENIVCSCRVCNSRKNKYRFHPVTGQGILL